jgi:hypothetical protein
LDAPLPLLLAAAAAAPDAVAVVVVAAPARLLLLLPLLPLPLSPPLPLAEISELLFPPTAVATAEADTTFGLRGAPGTPSLATGPREAATSAAEAAPCASSLFAIISKGAPAASGEETSLSRTARASANRAGLEASTMKTMPCASRMYLFCGRRAG